MESNLCQCEKWLNLRKSRSFERQQQCSDEHGAEDLELIGKGVGKNSEGKGPKESVGHENCSDGQRKTQKGGGPKSGLTLCEISKRG